MKRTKQRADIGGDEVPPYMSGCRKFAGEDVGYADRMKQQA